MTSILVGARFAKKLNSGRQEVNRVGRTASSAPDPTFSEFLICRTVGDKVGPQLAGRSKEVTFDEE